MTTDEIERSAMRDARGGVLNPPNDMLATYLYLSLHALYSRLYAGEITREDAKPIKTGLVGMYDTAKRLYDAKVELLENCTDLWKNVELASSEYAKNKTIENADKLYSAIYGGMKI